MKYLLLKKFSENINFTSSQSQKKFYSSVWIIKIPIQQQINKEMIRGINISSPFFNANCPAETKELNCVRPYCPFFHINKPNHFNIAEIKKKVSSTPLNLTDSEIFVPETPPHKLSNEYDRLNKSRATIQQENVIMNDSQFEVGGYVGYVAQDQGIESGMEQNNMSMGMSNQSSSSSLPFYPSTMMQSPAYAIYHPAYSHTPTFRSNQFSGSPYPTMEPIIPQITGYQSHGFSSCPTFSIQQPQDYHRPHNSSNHHFGKDEKRAKKEMPSYTPTPIVQLERENEAREKRRELIERQKRIRERLEGQKEEALKQQSKAKKEANGDMATPAESFPIDQILADQAELLAEHESNKVELEKRRQREKHKEQVEKCRKRKGFVSNDEKEPKNKKSNNQTAEALAENESPEWIRKRSSEEMMDEFGEEAAKWKAKTEDQMGKGSSYDDREDADEEARNAIKMIRMAKEKQEEEEKIAMMERMKKNREKPKTVIDELIKAEKMKKQKEAEESSKKKKRGVEKPEKEMTASPEKRTATQVNDCLKNVAQIDKSIEDLEKKIRRSTNKLARLPHISTASSSSSSGKKENELEKKKLLPIWRRPEKMKNALTNVLEDNLFNRAHQKSHENLIEKIFGKDDETKTVNEEKSKQENKKKKKERPIWEEINGVEKRRRSSSGSGKEEKKKMAKRIKEKEAEIIRQEQQKLVDLISDEEEEDGKTMMKSDSNDEEICFLAVVNKSGNVENNNLALSMSCTAKPEIMVMEKPAKKSTDETPSTSNPIAPSNANPNFNICPSSPAHSTASSVSVVPESPLSSPQQPKLAEIAGEKKKESVIPVKNNRPAQIPSAQEQLHSRTLRAMLKIADEQQNQEGRKDSTNFKKVKEEKASTTSGNREISANLSKQEGQKSRNSHQLPTSSPRIASSSTMTPSSSSMPVPSAKRPLPTTSVLPFKRESLAKYRPSVLQQQTLAASLKKGEQRKAHVPKFEILNAALKRQLIPLEPGNRKVSLQIRQARLALIHAEYVKICWDQPDLAIESAQQEEKAILDKCSTRMGYVSAIPNVIKRLREAAAENRGIGKERKNSVSHKNVLLGRHAESVTLGLNRAQRVAEHKATHLSESDFYEALANEYLLTEEELWTNGYPRWVENGEEEEEFKPDEINSDTGYSIAERKELPKRRCVEIRQSELETSKGRGQKQFVSDKELKRVCARCGVEYLLTKDGNYAPGISSEDCIYHWGRAWKKRTHGTVDTRYTCCDSPAGDRGCVVATRHITQSLRMSTLAKYVETPRPFGVGDPRSKKVYALDCEMIYCVWGPEVARISMVDVLGELVLDEFVRPEFALIDCNTKFSGLTAEQINNALNDLKKAQERLFELVNSETILIGHSLESDLRALRIVHKRVVDTSVVFPHRLGPPQKRALKTLATELLQLIIQEDETGHDSKEDALACMRIMLKKVRGGGAE